MATQCFNQQDEVLVASRKRSSDPQLPSIHAHSSEGFHIWWDRTSAQHSAVVAQASALKRAYQRVSSSNGARAGLAL